MRRRISYADVVATLALFFARSAAARWRRNTI
jgi:hypothetical protein